VFARRLVGIALIATLGFATHSLTLALVHPDRRPTQQLVAEPGVVRVRATARDEEQTVEFTLTNRARKQITIRRVSSNCRCVLVSDYDGSVLRPGQALKLAFYVRAPEFGVSRTRLEVAHDGGSAPAEMYVEATGTGTLPVVRDVRNGSPTFLALRSPQEHEQITIRTFEPLRSRPWITKLVCDLDAARFEELERRDEGRPADGLIEREYAYRVSWKRLPMTAEFSGRPLALTSLADDVPVRLGTVSGRLATARTFSPSVARLVPGEHPREIVLFDSDAVAWTIPRDVRLPDWLETEWLAGGAVQRLALRLRHTTSLTAGVYELPLEDGLGGRQTLTVVRTEPIAP